MRIALSSESVPVAKSSKYRSFSNALVVSGSLVEYLSFIYPERGGIGEIFPEVMIFPEGFSPREISSLKEIFRRIPRAEVYK